jgi:hypothetical protein
MTIGLFFAAWRLGGLAPLREILQARGFGIAWGTVFFHAKAAKPQRRKEEKTLIVLLCALSASV